MSYQISDTDIAQAQKLAFNWAARINMNMLDDFTSAAYYGLTIAATKYEPTHGAKFMTYAYTRIKGECADLLRREARYKSRYLIASQLERPPALSVEPARVEPNVAAAFERLPANEQELLTDFIILEKRPSANRELTYKLNLDRARALKRMRKLMRKQKRINKYSPRKGAI